MKKVTTYVADDGTVFKTQDECIEYEAMQAIPKIARYCSIHNPSCSGCAFLEEVDGTCRFGTLSPIDWDLYNDDNCPF